MPQVALLRGINVGGHHKMNMSDLREACEHMGLTRVRTYIQSGNLVFESSQTVEDLKASLETCLAEWFGFQVPVMVRTAERFRTALQSTPFADRSEHLHIGFLSAPPAPEAWAALSLMDFAPDVWHATDTEIHLLYPTGQARTRLTQTVLEKKLGVQVTVRNWKTLQALLKMLDP